MTPSSPAVAAPRFATLEEWLAWLETLHPKKIDMSLDRITRVLEALSLRPPPYCVITVGGTNGKGSCVAILESIYRHAGYRVGAFTSPHLWRFNERVRFDGRDATDEELLELFTSMDVARGDVTLSYFESSAVAAMLFFAQQRADVAVLEVGMGGRLDAVNALDADAALIASVDLDHVEWLGGDRDSVGWEKAGILRSGRPAVIGDPQPPSRLMQHAAAVGARALVIGRDFAGRGDAWPPEADGGAAGIDVSTSAAHAWHYRAPGGELLALPRPPFGGGDVQLRNAASCVAVVESLQRRLPVARDALAAGLRAARLRARLERHVVADVEWLFDVAHNPAAARVLADALDRLPPARKLLAVFAAMHDKDLAGVLAPFARRVDEWVVVQADSERGAPTAALVQVLAAHGAGDCVAADDIEAACARVQLRAAPGDRVLVFGSFHLVGPAMAAVGLYSAPT